MHNLARRVFIYSGNCNVSPISSMSITHVRMGTHRPLHHRPCRVVSLPTITCHHCRSLLLTTQPLPSQVSPEKTLPGLSTHRVQWGEVFVLPFILTLLVLGMVCCCWWWWCGGREGEGERKGGRFQSNRFIQLLPSHL